MSLSSRQIRMIAAIAGINVLLVAAGWLLVVGPQRQHAQAASQQLQQVRTQITQVSGLAGQQTGQRKQPVIKTSDIYRLEQAMPVTADESDLLLMLDQLAKASSVKVLSLSPQSPVAAVGYVTVPIQLSLQGTYAALTGYVHKLRMLVAVHHGRLDAKGRLLAVTSVSMSPAGKGSDETSSVAVNAFVYGSVNGVSPTSTTATDTTSTSTSTTSTTTG